jgi:hypothetical protein
MAQADRWTGRSQRHQDRTPMGGRAGARLKRPRFPLRARERCCGESRTHSRQNPPVIFPRRFSFSAAVKANRQSNKLDLHRQRIVTEKKIYKSHFNRCCTEISFDLVERW